LAAPAWFGTETAWFIHAQIMPGISRRFFFWSGAGLGAPLAVSPREKNETVYRFSTSECDVQMSVEFYDRYSSKSFWFAEKQANRHFCVSANGQEGGDCLANFSGSLAIARYHIRPRSKPPNFLALREHVRTIDQDSRVSIRPPFDRTIELHGGVASDIQAFGYETDGLPPTGGPAAPPNGPWSLLRQDLYFGGDMMPFLVVHWKHTINAIRLLDVIPGDQTRLVVSKSDR
jgi:hypothetical protein